MVQLCIFDLDGTLANTLDSIAGFANEALCRCGWKPILPKEDYRFLVGNGADCLMRRMLSIQRAHTQRRMCFVCEVCMMICMVRTLCVR